MGTRDLDKAQLADGLRDERIPASSDSPARDRRRFRAAARAVTVVGAACS